MLNHHGHTIFKAAEYVFKFLTGQLTPYEEAEFSRLKKETGLDKRWSQWENRQAWIQDLQETMDFDTSAAYAQFIQQTQKSSKRKRWLQIAAIAILLITVGGIGYYLNRREIPNPFKLTELIEPISHKAYIVLADGKKLELQEKGENIQEQDGTIISHQAGQLVYDPIEKKPQETIYNTLNVPRGGEFRIVLSDGTGIWLNSESSLKYPVNFTGKNREVFLSGEAYFEVKSDSTRPFIVHTSLGKINVLGTEFNVRDYQDEQEVVTTLVKGKVKYQDNRNANPEIVLQPGYQVTASQNDPELSVHPVNLKLYVGWKDGLYIFRNLTLAEIMKTIERNYDVQVVYTSEEIKHLRFSGDLKKYDRVESFLRFIEIGGDVTFKIKDKIITVTSK